MKKLIMLMCLMLVFTTVAFADQTVIAFTDQAVEISIDNTSVSADVMTTSDDVMMIDIVDIADAMGIEVTQNASMGNVTVRSGSFFTVLSDGSDIAVISGNKMPLQAAVQIVDGNVYVPVANIMFITNGQVVSFSKDAIKLKSSQAVMQENIEKHELFVQTYPEWAKAIKKMMDSTYHFNVDFDMNAAAHMQSEGYSMDMDDITFSGRLNGLNVYPNVAVSGSMSMSAMGSQDSTTFGVVYKDKTLYFRESDMWTKIEDTDFEEVVSLWNLALLYVDNEYYGAGYADLIPYVEVSEEAEQTKYSIVFNQDIFNDLVAEYYEGKTFEDILKEEGAELDRFAFNNVSLTYVVKDEVLTEMIFNVDIDFEADGISVEIDMNADGTFSDYGTVQTIRTPTVLY